MSSKLDKARFALALTSDIARYIGALFDAFDGDPDQAREHIARVTPYKLSVHRDRAKVDAELEETRRLIRERTAAKDPKP